MPSLCFFSRLFLRTAHSTQHADSSGTPSMPPKVSQLLTRVLAREHDDEGSSSSSSEEDYGLKQLAAGASAGLKMGERW